MFRSGVTSGFQGHSPMLCNPNQSPLIKSPRLVPSLMMIRDGGTKLYSEKISVKRRCGEYNLSQLEVFPNAMCKYGGKQHWVPS